MSRTGLRPILAGVLVMALASGTACDSCAPARAVDGGTSAVDAHVVPQGSLLALDAIPIERLCEVFNAGYNRYLMAVMFGLAGAGQVLDDYIDQCGGQLDERSYDFLSYSPEALRTECLPTAPTALRTLNQRLLVSVNAGRARYDGFRARECLAGGRAFVDEHGGLLRVFSTSFDASVPDANFVTAACDGWLAGQVGVGGDCDEHWECQGTAFCKRTAQSCAGSCSSEVALGQPCDAFDRCAGSASCEDGRCTADTVADAGSTLDAGLVGVDQFCGYSEDAGSEFECRDGLYCGDDERCHPLPANGQACTPSGECSDGGVCGPGSVDGGVCGPPRPAGQECTGFPSCCELCSPCTPQNSVDDGPAYCRALRAAGEPCGPGQGSCLLGTVCARSQCRALAERGEPCWVDVDDDGFNGNCLAGADYCDGPESDGAGHCTLRPGEGESCRSLARPGSQQGNCLGSYLFCKRDSNAATSGTCVRNPLAGEACGDRHDLGATCDDPDPTGLLVFGGPSCDGVDGGPGVCRSGEQPAAAGDPCDYDGDCPAGHYCHDQNLVCTPGAALGEVCGSANSYTCLAGRCDSGGPDAGYQTICQPFFALGAACGYAGDDDCGPSARCAGSDDAGYLCSALAQAGERCSSGSECATGDCANGVCIAGGQCARDDCSGCSNTSTLSAFIFFAAVLWGDPLRRFRRRR